MGVSFHALTKLLGAHFNLFGLSLIRPSVLIRIPATRAVRPGFSRGLRQTFPARCADENGFSVKPLFCLITGEPNELV
jgi:hypothetical protein